MDKKGERLAILAEKCEKLKKEFSEQKNLHFFDLLIDCGNIILPAHKFVLCSRSDVLAQRLSPDVNELNWTDYGSDFGIALLRWIYTNKVDFNNVTVPIGLSSVSHWEHLLSLVNEGTNDETIIKYHNIGKIVGSDGLVAKCLELRPNCFFSSVLKSQQVKVNHQANANLHGCDTQMEVDTENEQRVNDLAEEVTKFEKISIGCREFGTFSDLSVCIYKGLGDWPGHKYFLSNRSTKIRDEISGAKNSRICKNSVRMDGLNWPAHEYVLSNRSTKIRYEISGAEDSRIYDITPAFLRWLYTDVLELESVDAAIGMLYISRRYKLPTLLEQCEEASLKKVDITSCVKFLEIATDTGATKILRRCQELIKSYGKVLQSEGSLKMGVDFDNSGGHSSCGKETCELPQEGAVGLLDLNDDCLFHLFRYLPLVDLGSIKDTCKRLSQLADQSFKLRKDKSITIQGDSMLADIWNLTHFGKLMNSLAVYDIYEEFASLSEIFQMIAKYSNEQLKAFTVDLCDVTDESLPCLEKVLKNVETIKLVSRNNSVHIDLILGYCENLRDVDIKMFKPINIEALFCSKNVNITCLALKYMQDDQILVQICEKLPNLECFEFSSFKFSSNNMSCLSQLDHLKRLKIECGDAPIGNALQKFAEENHLEYLCLSRVIVCEALAQTLGHFQNLKELVLGLDYGFEGNSKNILSKTLANVEKIAFVRYYVEVNGFGDVTQIVENLLNLKELSVYSRSDYTFIDINNYLRLTKNRNRDLEIFLNESEYKRSIACIGNDLSKYVRVTARPSEFFDKLCSPKVMN